MTKVAASNDSELIAVRRWFHYISDARTAYLEALSQLETTLVTEDRGASYPSILDIFAHALVAFEGWIVYAFQDAIEPERNQSGWTLSETIAFKGQVQEIVERFVAELTPERLEREFTFHWTPGVESTRVTMKTRDMLYHLVEEELQHRGEINALLWEKDVSVPILAWDDWVRVQSP